MDTLKLKRQVRDHFNKNVNDLDTLISVANVIGYTIKPEAWYDIDTKECIEVYQKN